jgi:hypothetical protein
MISSFWFCLGCGIKFRRTLVSVKETCLFTAFSLHFEPVRAEIWCREGLSNKFFRKNIPHPSVFSNLYISAQFCTM